MGDCCTISPYFSNDVNTVTPCQEQVQQFDRLINLLENNEAFKETLRKDPYAKQAIAFYIEASKQHQAFLEHGKSHQISDWNNLDDVEIRISSIWEKVEIAKRSYLEADNAYNKAPEDASHLEAFAAAKKSYQAAVVESYDEAAYFLYQVITFIYTTVLQYQIEKIPEKSKFTARMLKNYENLIKLNERQKKVGEPVKIGGINQTYLPSWYFKHFPEQPVSS